MKKSIQLIAVFLLVFPELACGYSPILNHRTPDRNGLRGGDEAPEDSAPCGIAFPQTGLCARLDWEKVPTEEETGVFLLKLSRAGAPEGVLTDPPAGLTLAVKLWMPSMGHGSSPVKIVRVQTSGGSIVPGVFRVENVHFVMPGAWEIRVMLRDPDGKPVEQAALPYQAGG